MLALGTHPTNPPLPRLCVQLTGSIPADLDLPPALQELWLSLNNFTGPLPTELTLPTSLINLVWAPASGFAHSSSCW
jgi:hypothetical protein